MESFTQISIIVSGFYFRQALLFFLLSASGMTLDMDRAYGILAEIRIEGLTALSACIWQRDTLHS